MKSPHTVFYRMKALFSFYASRIIVRCAETERVPPATGEMLIDATLPRGFRTVRCEFGALVVSRDIPTI